MNILFTGGSVVTMDPELGDLARGDVLVSGEHIVAVGPDLRDHPQARGAEIVDTTGRIVSPGFVDTHRHAWQAQLRRSIPDVTDLGAYVTSTLARIAPAYRAHDVYVGTRLAALSALDAGITTMLDFSHNSRSAAHSDAAIQALVDTGIRGVHASMAPHFGDWDQQWPQDVQRLHAAHSSGLVTVRLATLATSEIAGPLHAYAPRLAAFARELGIGVSVDAVFGMSSSAAILDWAKDGLLGPHVTLIHATGLTVEAWRAIGDTGTTVSLAPTSDAQIGLETAIPAIDEALAAGVRPGLSIDVEVALASDMFTQMRALHAIQRMRAVNRAYGTDAIPNRITTRDVLDFATLQGARTNGLDSITGSLTPGKQADLLVVNATDVNTMPLNDAVGTLVLGADPRNIETVLVAGVIRKSGGRLVGVDAAQLHEQVVASRDAILATAAS
ncbi:Melamine deaminase [Actinomadura rubteroloni]|uniref:Melamine deaminase n=1 Tax=Actinomadura rubteroloni TaxID=1926885 RepID=A0A2P4UCK9_9ACTN|nr:amidohydrolase family protein [Actinomadura rubteroloni]POM22784.1 Melamine deaminase [Actinomadura rubteroloni]